jgi:hypothetical protein
LLRSSELVSGSVPGSARFVSLIDAQTADQIQTFAGLEVDLRVHAIEVAFVLDLSRFVDLDAVRIRRVGAVRQHAIFKIVAVLLAVAVQPIETEGPGQFFGRMRGDKRVEVGIGQRDFLAKAVGIVRHAVVGKSVAQKAARIVAVGMINRECRHPVAEANIAFQPGIELHAILILARVERVDVGIQREARRQHAVLDRMRTVRILAQHRRIDIEVELAQIGVAGGTIQNMTTIHAGTILAEILGRDIRTERLLERAPIRQVAADRGNASAARARADRHARGRGPRRVVNDLDDADE